MLRPAPSRSVRRSSLPELKRLGSTYWLVVAVAGVFTLARFSEAFLLLRAQSVGVAARCRARWCMVVMNVVYALVGLARGRVVRPASAATVCSRPDLRCWSPPISRLLSRLASPMLGIGVALWGLHMGLTQGLLASLVADHAPAQLRGTAFGMFNLITGIATLLASVIAGALWDQIGPTGTFLASAAFTAAALAVLPATKKGGLATVYSGRE